MECLLDGGSGMAGDSMLLLGLKRWLRILERGGDVSAKDPSREMMRKGGREGVLTTNLLFRTR